MLQQIAKQVSVLTDGIGTALLKSKQQNELLEEKINDLQAKQKRVKRAEILFYKDVDEHRNEIMKRFAQKDRLAMVAEEYGTDADTLYAWLKEPAQLEMFRKKH